MRAVSLYPQHWLMLTESDDAGHLVAPIMVHLSDENGNFLLGLEQENLSAVLDEAAANIPRAVFAIHRFW